MGEEITITGERSSRTPGLSPVIRNVPVLHRDRQIGTASLGPEREIHIELEMEFDSDAIKNMFLIGMAEGLTLGLKVEPATEKVGE